MSTGSNQPSTLQSVVDSVKGTAQNLVGAVTGNTADKQAAADKHNKADAERDLSKSGASVGPLNVSGAGVTVDNKDRIHGQKDQTLGSGKEFVGNLVGNKSLTDEGRDQNAQGQTRETVGQVKDFVGGAADRVVGTVGSGLASVTGNKNAEQSYQKQHDKGKTNLRGVQDEI
ncbi:hypothetical protein EX30DRAFT_318748 [Ascodesmis nigricans]|uniref:CsbD-like domain-containing protein n=1 Tax=Ascodesmis nigricans TaxID=341454 RepID=A0A4S2MY01_9PEZI|nr:hypothetical protein EX30DRAFT_318748 [Ascodesmis nigricans]